MDTSPLEGWGNVLPDATEHFCKSFVQESDFRGEIARVVASGALPQGVDPYDPRVLAIRRKCREWAEQEAESPFTD